MTASLEVLFAPAEFAALRERDLSQTVCVVFDILRATSTMMTALGNGAVEIMPVGEIADAVAIYQARPSVLLAGERNGHRIRASQSGGVDFHLGNSPREFVRSMVLGRTIVMTTTNGTRALQACASAQATLIGSFLGLGALAKRLTDLRPAQLLLVCAGTFEQSSYEDTLAAGALCDLIWRQYNPDLVSDSALIARQIYQQAGDDLLAALSLARNARRLLSQPELRDDVAFCGQRNTLGFVAQMSPGGLIQKI